MNTDGLIILGVVAVGALIYAMKWLGRRGLISSAEARFDSKIGKQIRND